MLYVVVFDLASRDLSHHAHALIVAIEPKVTLGKPLRIREELEPGRRTLASVGRAEQITRSSSLAWSGWMRPSLAVPRSFLPLLEAGSLGFTQTGLSPTCVLSLSQAVREVLCHRGLSHESRQ